MEIATGNKPIGSTFQSPTVAVINSHQPLFPTRDCPWIQATMAAIDMLSQEDIVLVSSIGLSSHEFALWYAGRLGMRQLVVVPAGKKSEPDVIGKRVLKEFGLSPKRTAFYFLFSSANPKTSLERDRQMISLADTVFPVAVRKKGRLRGLIEEKLIGSVDRRFQIPFTNKMISGFPVKVTNKRLLSDPWKSLTHWTRRFSGPIPGQSKAEYYRNLIETEAGEAGTAITSLCGILEKKQIVASGKGIRGALPVVSFTSLPPDRCMDFMEWNFARVRFRFEPFGIAFSKRYLKEKGIRPAIYGDEHVFRRLGREYRPFYQSEGKEKQWRKEREWRYPGSFDFSDICRSDILVLVPGKDHAQKIENRFPEYRVETLEE